MQHSAGGTHGTCPPCARKNRAWGHAGGHRREPEATAPLRRCPTVGLGVDSRPLRTAAVREAELCDGGRDSSLRISLKCFSAPGSGILAGETQGVPGGLWRTQQSCGEDRTPPDKKLFFLNFLVQMRTFPLIIKIKKHLLLKDFF